MCVCVCAYTASLSVLHAGTHTRTYLEAIQHIHLMLPSRDAQHRGIVLGRVVRVGVGLEEVAERLGVRGGGRDDDAELRPLAPHLLQQAQEDVGVAGGGMCVCVVVCVWLCVCL